MKKLLLPALFAASAVSLSAQNPIISNQFTADPTARAFNGRIYLYPSHDIQSPIERLNDWFCMADYHVFSSSNLVDWTDHGMIVSQDDVQWVEPGSYAMWAPDCVEQGGKYYFYFPSQPKGERGFGVGVAIGDSPEGPFIPEPKPIEGIHGIDPCVLVDDDGACYIYWSGMGIRGARLAADMKSLAGEPQVMSGLPEGFKEGPFVFKRNGVYYLTFPWVREENGTETLAYCMSHSPLGPWEFKGLIMEEHPSGCWTNHHSIVEYDGQWYLFYHHNDYSPSMDKRRSARADYITFNPDGTINTVEPTLRGVGHVQTSDAVQIDRYSLKSDSGVTLDFVDENNPFKGWYASFDTPGAWVRFDRVNFGNGDFGAIRANCRSHGGGVIRIEAIDSAGCNRTLCELDVPAADDFTLACSDRCANLPTGIVDLRVDLVEGDADVDYLTFDAVQSAGVADGNYFTIPESDCSAPDSKGFIRRWLLLEPIDKPNRSNTVFTDSYLRDAFSDNYFSGQLMHVPSDGDTVDVDGNALRWHDVESTGYNVHLFRFASTRGLKVYGVLFWAVTVIDSPREYNDVRLMAGSNSASMWWLDGKEVLLMSGDRRMVADDACSERLTLRKGRNVLWCAVINGPGMSNFCARFVDEQDNPIKDLKICTK